MLDDTHGDNIAYRHGLLLSNCCDLLGCDDAAVVDGAIFAALVAVGEDDVDLRWGFVSSKLKILDCLSVIKSKNASKPHWCPEP